MSETILFHDPGRTHPSHKTSLTMGLSGSHSLYSNAFMTRVARERFDKRENEHIPANVHKNALGLYVSSYRKGVGFSATLGPAVLGADFTANLWRRNYFTASVSASGGTEMILHHRTFNSPYVGASLGLAFRHEKVYFSAGSGAGIPAFDGVGINSVGLRAIGIYRTAPTDSGVLHGGLYVGYAPRYRQPIVSLSVSFGGF